MPNGTTYLQGQYWIITLPQHLFTPFLPMGVRYIKGQLEIGIETGYTHWQLVCYFQRRVRIRSLQETFGGEGHFELTRSAAAGDYVWKDDTSVAGTRFELGQKPLDRSKPSDWEQVWGFASRGELGSIPPDIRVRCYQTLRTISRDHMVAQPMERTCFVYWGETGTGKSRKAWDLAGWDAYPKDPNTKFWDGYQQHKNVVIDEFRGIISISNMLRWLDRYPVCVEIKGSAVPLVATTIWITSNVNPRDWYKDIDNATKEALLRRLIITQFVFPRN